MTSQLTILIPTWKRRHELQTLLSVILPAVAMNPEIDLVISDNGSIDPLKMDYLAGIAGRPRVRVLLQPINYGFHIHLAWLYGQAAGRFLWLIGDDDVLAPHSVERVLDSIKRFPDIGWLHLPCEHEFESGVFTRTPVPHTDLRVARARDVMEEYFFAMMFISGNIVRSEALHRHLPSISFENSFWPFDLFLRSVADLPGVILSDLLIRAGPEITWSDRWAEITYFDQPNVILNSSVLSREEKSIVLWKRYKDSPDAMLRLALIHPALLWRLVVLQPQFLRAFASGAVLQKLFSPRIWRKAVAYMRGGAPSVGRLFSRDHLKKRS